MPVKAGTPDTRYCLDNDDDGHWYLVPAEAKNAFNAWIYEDASEPAGVVRLAGHPNNVTFTVPEEFGQAIGDRAA